MNRLVTGYAVPVFLAFAGLTTSSGCFFYLDDDDECEDYGAIAGGAQEALGLRDPESGICEYFGVSNPRPCPDGCACAYPAGDEAPGQQAPIPTWGYCESDCSALGESSCLDTSGCRGIYETGTTNFLECWSTDQTGPAQADDCANLDALSCSVNDNCVAYHEWPCATGAPDQDFVCGPGSFVACGDEGGSSNPGICYGEVSCDTEPPECPADTMPGIDNGCWTGFCIPNDECESAPACSAISAEPTCIARADCDPSYRGVNCTCEGEVCTCEEWLYDGCEETLDF